MKTHTKGLLIAGFGVLVLSPDSMLIRLAHVDEGAILFWRGIFTTAGLALLAWVIHRQNTVKVFKNLGMPGLGVAVIFSISTLTFITAVLNTSVAHVLVIITTSSIFAALLSQWLLKEPTALVTWLTMIVVLTAMVFIFKDGLSKGRIWGDFLALVSALCIALSLVLTRKNRHIDMVPAMSVSGVFVTVVGFILADTVMVNSSSFIVLLLTGLIVTISYACFAISPRYVSAPEVSLMIPLETIFGSLLVWQVIGERPSNIALICGFVIIASLTLHSLYKIRTASDDS